MENNTTDNNIIYKVLKGIIAGVLCGYIILFALRPSVPNPDSILEIIENKYVIIPLVLINYYLYEWDLLIGILFSICIVSLIFDYFIFINKGLKKIKNKNIDYENNKNIIENFTVNDNLKNMFQKLLVFLEIN
jgi:hypothetical protein|tara:strand:+ start:2002 stop:2400 length:399 start_codon:yes stop_codon:yes gene_type:complete